MQHIFVSTAVFLLSFSVGRGVATLVNDNQQCTPCAASYDHSGGFPSDLQDMEDSLTCADGYCTGDCDKSSGQTGGASAGSMSVKCDCPTSEDVCYLHVKVTWSSEPIPSKYWIVTCKGSGPDNKCDGADAPAGCDQLTCCMTITPTSFFCKCKDGACGS